YATVFERSVNTPAVPGGRLRHLSDTHARLREMTANDTPRSEPDDGDLLTAEEVAAYLRLPTVRALYSMRARGTAPPAVKVGRRGLRFRRGDVDRWPAAREEGAQRRSE